MRSLHDLSIKRKLTLIILLTTIVALLVAGVVFGAYDLVMFRQLMVRQLQTEAQIIGANSTAALAFRDPRAAEEILNALRAEQDVEAACIHAADGQVFAQYVKAGGAGIAIPSVPREHGHRFDANELELEQPIVLAGKPIGSVYLRSNLQGMRARLQRYAVIGALIMLASCLVAFVLSTRLQRVVSGPILHLAWAARSVALERNYSVRAAKSADDELGDLTDAFNDMLRQIQERDAALVRQAEELERSNRELNEFAYVVSHDLKAPLRGINSLATWLVTDYADRLDASGKEQLALLVGRVARMNSLIDGILTYSRAGRVREEKVELNLNDLVREVIELIGKPANVEITLERELPTLRAERTRLQQVFQNLIANAVKFLDKPQGQIRIGCVDDGRYWKSYVADNGPGIAAQHFDKIFQVFQTLTPRDEHESTGIGLAVVKKIIEQSGGKVWVESTVGEGSTFYFTLPK